MNETLPWILHVLRRHAVIEVTRHALHGEAIYAGTAPGFCGREGISVYQEFHHRLRAISHPPVNQSAPSDLHAAEVAAFERIAARANDPT